MPAVTIRPAAARILLVAALAVAPAAAVVAATPAIPDSPASPLDPATAGESCAIPYSYSLNADYGAEATLPGGGWDWQLLAEGSDYVVADGVVTLATTGTGLPKFRIIRLGLIHDF